MFYLANIDSLLAEFGVDWPMFFAQVINFVLVAFLIYRFGFKGVLSTMQEREKQISDSLKHAETIKLELEEIERKQKETLKDASLIAKDTVSKAKDQAKSFAESQKEEARKQAEDIIAKAKESTELERERVLKEAKKEISSLVVLTTAKVLDKELSEDEKTRFSNVAAKELNLAD